MDPQSVAILLLGAVVLIQAAILVDHGKRLVALRGRLSILSPVQIGKLAGSGEDAMLHLPKIGAAPTVRWQELMPEGNLLIVWLHPRSFASSHLAYQVRDYIASRRIAPPPAPVVVLFEGKKHEVMNAVKEARLDMSAVYWVGDGEAMAALGIRWRPGVLSVVGGHLGKAAQVFDITQLVEFAESEFSRTKSVGGTADVISGGTRTYQN